MKRSTLAAGVALAALTLGGAVQAQDDNEFVIFDWAGYEDPNFFQSYVEEHGDAPSFAFFGDEEEAFQKLRAGFQADAAHPCAQSVPKWREAGLLEPIDTSKIEGWENVMEGFRNMPGFSEGGQQYIVPLDWGATALTYRNDMLSEEEADTLQTFTDPKYQGRTSIPDNVDDAYALAFLATGVKDWTQATDADFQAASDWLRDAHKNVRTYWQDGATLGQLMSSGEVPLAWAWNETAVTLEAEDVPVEMNRGTEEGYSTWVCGYVKLAGSDGPDEKFYDFINAWMDQRTADYIVNAWGYGHSNAAAMAKIDPEVLETAGFDNLDEYTGDTLWQAPVPAELREKMIAEFEKIKAGF